MNGLTFEKNTLLKIIPEGFKRFTGRQFNKKESTMDIDTSFGKCHGCIFPDEVILQSSKVEGISVLHNPCLYIIEKKYQNTKGSACEKIQTWEFKNWYYTRKFKNHKVYYIYCLSNWFKENCKTEIEYLLSKGANIFWGETEGYEKDLLEFIVKTSKKTIDDSAFLEAFSFKFM
jgi:hypothetical protein